jgi:NADH-quinone oxidoreductase subunit M
MGTYGFLRFSLPICPSASATDWVQLTIVVLSIVGIIYGSLVAMVQKDMKKLVAYSSVAHLGFVMVGIFAFNNAGMQGGVIQSINHGLSTGGLFLLVGIIYERRHTRQIVDFGGISQVMPIYATLFMIILLASIGLPLLNGFVGEFTILVGAFLADWRWALFASLGVVLGAAYMLWLYQRVFFGELKHEENKVLQDVNLREVLTLAPLVVACFWIGVYPKPFFAMTAPASAKIVAAVEKARGGETRTAASVSVPAAIAPAGAVAADVVPAAVVKGN